MDFISHVVVCLLLSSTTSANPLIPTNKLSLATWGSYYQQDHKGPGTYAFGYDIEDPVTGNVQFKQEERHPNGTVTGNYGYVDAEGKPHVVTYVSDAKGYRAKVEIEGESTRYFPDAASFWGNSLESQPTGGEEQTVLPSPNVFRHSGRDMRVVTPREPNPPPESHFTIPFYFTYEIN